MAVELATAYISIVPSAKGITGKLEAELGGLDDVADSAGDSAGGAYSGKFLDIAKGALLAGAAALGAVVTKGLVDAIETEAVGDKLNAQLGATGAYAEDLGKVAGDLYADAYGDSLGQVNEALRGVVQQGLLDEDATNEQLEAVTAKVLDLATAFDQDLAGATSAVSQLLRTGLADNADEALDIITRGFQQGVDVQGDYLDTLREYGTQFRTLGLDAETATGLMSQGLQAGARDADIVADALKEFGIRTKENLDPAAEAFASIGLSADDMQAKIAAGGPDAAAALDQTLDALRQIEDPALRNAAAVELFGTQSEDMQDALLALDPSTAVKSLGTIEGAATDMGDTLNDNAAARIESFKRETLQGLATFMGDNVLPVLEDFGAWAGEVIPPLLDDFRTGVERVTDVLGRVDWAGVFADIEAVVGPVVDWITTVAAPAIGAVVGHIADAVGDAVTFIVDNTGAVREAIGHIVNVILAIWDTFGQTLITWVVDVWSFIRSTIENVINVIRNIIVFVLAVINGDWGKAWDALLGVVGAVWDQILAVIGFVLDAIKAVIGLAWDAIVAVASIAWDVIKAVIGAAWDWIWDKISGVVDTIKRGISTGFDIIKTLITAPIDGAKTLVSDLFDDISGLFSSLPGRLGDALGGLADAATAPFEAMGDAIAKAWNDTIGGFSFTIPDVPGVPMRGETIKIPEMHTGGPVAGRPGAEVLRILEAGEWVLSRDDVTQIRRGSGVPGLAATGGGLTIGTLAVTTVADATADEVVGAINAKLGWAHTGRRDR